MPSSSSRARREPALNVPPLLAGFVVLLLAIQGLREIVSDLTNLRILLEFGFLPAQWSAAFEVRSLDEIVHAAGAGLADPQVAALRAAFARLIMSDPQPAPWSLLTYAFLHGSWTHVLLNSVWLVAFGSPVVKRAGSARSLLLMIATALAGAAAHWATNLSSVQPMIGASAVASGFMGAAVTFVFSPPSRPALLGAGPGSQPGRGSILTNRNAMIFIGLWFVTNILFGVVAVPTGLSGAGVAWEAHIGGFLTGLFLFPWLDPDRRRATPPIPYA